MASMSEENGKKREAQRRAFLDGVRDGGTVLSGLQRGGFSRTTFQRWAYSEDDAVRIEGFKEDFLQALEDYRDSLITEAGSRGRDGWHEPVVHAGSVVWQRNPDGTLRLDDDFEPIPLTTRKHSDILLIAQLKAHDPRYREKAALEVSGPDGGPIDTHIEVVFVKAENGKPAPGEDAGDADDGEADPLD